MDRLIKYLLIGGLICLVIAFGASLYYGWWSRAITNAIWIMVALCTIHIDKALNNAKKTIKMQADYIESYEKVTNRLFMIIYSILKKAEDRQTEQEVNKDE